MLVSFARNQHHKSARALDADRSLLSNVALFSDLSSSELTSIEQACCYRRFSAQEHIVERNSGSTDIFFVVRGRVRVVNYSLQGREITFDEVGEGGYFGELSALDGRPRSASVVAVTDSLILALPSRVFRSVLARHPDLALNTMIGLAASVRTAQERIMDLSTLAAHHRVQAEMLRQALLHKTGPNTARIQPMPLHSDIASRVSTTRETVARVLNELSRMGIMERGQKAFIVHDVDRLQQMVDEVRG
jgi:CRP-like cAMP-binding protein